MEHYFENGIKEVTPYVLEPGSEGDLRALVSILDSRNHGSINFYLIQLDLLAGKHEFAVCNLFIHDVSTIHLTGPTGQEWGSYLNSEDLSSRRGPNFYETIQPNRI